ncbi:hypothetical protein L914_05506 [Phytophthora nicotianae]|uniref:Uncharacterized protein n=1 Tax=Phytophthora nicotianae TaxID=4792 RepID=W2NR80_PHYNI|nr:hypothetical protein L914_05506 [Phytophthora nicotianae]
MITQHPGKSKATPSRPHPTEKLPCRTLAATTHETQVDAAADQSVPPPLPPTEMLTLPPTTEMLKLPTETLPPPT